MGVVGRAVQCLHDLLTSQSKGVEIHEFGKLTFMAIVHQLLVNGSNGQ